VSPIVGGAAVKGPASKMMLELGLESSVLAVVKHYGGLVDGWVIDSRDVDAASEVRALGKTVHVTDTLMTDRDKSAALAREVVDFVGTCKSPRRA
jgi:LPPG:FO 2-phospho-L-lactate transferase